jgi:hypothetical protein
MRNLSALLFVLITIVLGWFRFKEVSQYQQLLRDMQAVHVAVHLSPPVCGEQAIQAAISIFSIDTSGTDIGFDPTIWDRGIISMSGDGRMHVDIGPSACSSWASLGSTIAHETEVHAKQVWAVGIALNVVSRTVNGFRGVRIADHEESVGSTRFEREAYLFEIESRDRFGLSDDEVDAIFSIVNFYYPEERAEMWPLKF